MTSRGRGQARPWPCVTTIYTLRQSVGARADDEGLGGPLWSPAGWGVVVFSIGIKLKNTHMEATGIPHATPRAGASPARTLYGRHFHPCRGEGGGRVAGRAFMVARGVGSDRVSPTWKPDEQDAGDHKGPPFRSPPLSPLRTLMGLVFGGCVLGDRQCLRPYNDYGGTLAGDQPHSVGCCVSCSSSGSRQSFSLESLSAWRVGSGRR